MFFCFCFRPEAQWSIFVHGLCFVRIVLYFLLLTLCTTTKNYFKMPLKVSYLLFPWFLRFNFTTWDILKYFSSISRWVECGIEVSVRVLGFGIPPSLLGTSVYLPSGNDGSHYCCSPPPPPPGQKQRSKKPGKSPNESLISPHTCAFLCYKRTACAVESLSVVT